MDTDLHISWTTDSLKDLLIKVIASGEASKVDFKTKCELASAAQKAELARDIQALANSSELAYRNHGFIILGASAVDGLVGTTFAQSADPMQATVDQIVKEHLGPFVQTHLRHFETDGKTWGVIVVPPSRNAPHVFIRDTVSYHKGDIWVRVGTTSSKAGPEDFGRFFRLHADDVARTLREEMGDIRRDLLQQIKAQAQTHAVAKTSKKISASNSVPAPASPSPGPSVPVETDLVEIARRSFKESEDPLVQGLEKEATALRAFLDSGAVRWDLNQITKESGREAVHKIEAQAATLWKAIATIVERDEAGKYTEALVESLKVIAFDPHSPSHTVFTSFGTGIRLYPLTMALYIIFLTGLQKERYDLLAEVLTIELEPKSEYDQPKPVGEALFHVRQASEVFQAMRDDYPAQRWCDSVGSYAQRWITAHLLVDRPQLARQGRLFYVAEFLLSLVGASADDVGLPASGLFFFMSESTPAITKFLKSHRQPLEQMFGTKLRTVLERFDEWGPKMSGTGTCWAQGFRAGSVAIVFPEEGALGSHKA